MVPTLEGIIRRRVLLNFRADPAAVQALLPPPLEVLPHNGFAIVGICLIGMEQLRPKGLPAAFGLASENIAHRVAIRYPSGEGLHDGVFVWRRDTDQCLVSLLGGRLFPGVHGRAEFEISELDEGLSIKVSTAKADADVDLEARYSQEWRPSAAFADFAEACNFMRRGDCGFSCSLRSGKLDGMQLKTLDWSMSPLHVTRLRARFFEEGNRFGPAGVEFDSALLMRGIAHEWHELSGITELAGVG